MRTEIFSKTLKEKNIDIAILMQSTDIFYYSGTFANGVLIITKDNEKFLFVRRGLDRALKETNISVSYMHSFSDIKKFIQQNGFKSETVGLEFDVLPVSFYQKFKEIFDRSQLIDISNDIRWQRRIKDSIELENITQAAKSLDCLMSDAKIYLEENKREIDISAKLEYFARLRGHQGRNRMRMFNGEIFMGHVICGFNAVGFSGYLKPLTGKGMYPTYPEGASTDRIEKDKPIIVDFVFNYNGYLADQTRTFVIGDLNSDLLKGYQFCFDLINWFEDYAKPGTKAVDIYTKSLEKAKNAGYENIFMGIGKDRVSFLGHGLGLELDEYPFIAKGMDYPLEENMVFAFEPKLIFKEGAVGLENTYVVRKDCVESLTKFPKQLVKL
ncbi:MAG: M24 family metallopeptidase [Desulfurella sp.]|uniref:Xaa-Pro aminopeptidase n=1 Tax=Desulfurella multipotens TaxID=79269 RepID=A0A1G6MJX8_9BACT|nr:Xaa-Pro peptidase family protein [Desulfurella multipotens]PMP66601.1 MAG: aminopeptidase P family protein [Desulfurella multipotens]SDC55296.1 Xaa-Pro aminopeptidase [Desulfurella multipotens]